MIGRRVFAVEKVEIEIIERVILIESKMPMRKRSMIAECEELMRTHGKVLNYKKVSSELVFLTGWIYPGRLLLFIRSLQKNYRIKSEVEDFFLPKKNTEEVNHIKLLMTVSDMAKKESVKVVKTKGAV